MARKYKVPTPTSWASESKQEVLPVVEQQWPVLTLAEMNGITYEVRTWQDGSQYARPHNPGGERIAAGPWYQYMMQSKRQLLALRTVTTAPDDLLEDPEPTQEEQS